MRKRLAKKLCKRGDARGRQHLIRRIQRWNIRREILPEEVDAFARDMRQGFRNACANAGFNLDHLLFGVGR